MTMTTNVSKMFATRNDLMREVRAEMISLLNQQLADTFDLYSQVKQAHWNVNKTAELGDQATNDLYIEIAREIDKKVWFIEAHLRIFSRVATAGTILHASPQLARPSLPRSTPNDSVKGCAATSGAMSKPFPGASPSTWC